MEVLGRLLPAGNRQLQTRLMPLRLLFRKTGRFGFSGPA